MGNGIPHMQCFCQPAFRWRLSPSVDVKSGMEISGDVPEHKCFQTNNSEVRSNVLVVLL